MGHINFGGAMWLDPNKKGLIDVHFAHKKLVIGTEKSYPINMKWRHIPIKNNLADMNFNMSISESALSPASIY